MPARAEGYLQVWEGSEAGGGERWRGAPRKGDQMETLVKRLVQGFLGIGSEVRAMRMAGAPVVRPKASCQQRTPWQHGKSWRHLRQPRWEAWGVQRKMKQALDVAQRRAQTVQADLQRSLEF